MDCPAICAKCLDTVCTHVLGWYVKAKCSKVLYKQDKMEPILNESKVRKLRGV